jgi:citrate synthase
VAFESGLEAVIVAETEISEVDGPHGRLIYRGGHLIEQVFQRTFEEVSYLLWHGGYPSAAELAAFVKELARLRPLSAPARAALSGLPAAVDPMDALRTVLSAHGARPGCPTATVSDAMALVAVLPSIVAGFHRHRSGLPPLEPNDDLTHAANLLYLLDGAPAADERVAWLERYLVVTADHALSPSTFTAQVVGSTGADLCSAIVAAIAALKGPAHGGATVGAYQMLTRAGAAGNAEAFVHDALARGERLMGFGHREYRQYDPRARLLRELCRKANPGYFETAAAVEEVALGEFRRRYPERPHMTNVDYYAGGVLSAAGIPADLFTCIFAVARTVGWTAHVIEYAARGGRIISPASRWVGPDPDGWMS